jgi:hypothetical protein|tara:strand:- start:38 stop:325 length:288 start_codon:yes stop_codon:yes gene_type:complete
MAENTDGLRNRVEQVARDIATNRWALGGLAAIGTVVLGFMFQAQLGMAKQMADVTVSLSRTSAILDRMDNLGSRALSEHEDDDADQAHRARRSSR